MAKSLEHEICHSDLQIVQGHLQRQNEMQFIKV